MIKAVANSGDEAIKLINKYGTDDVVKVIANYGDDAIKAVEKSEDNAISIYKQYSENGLKSVANFGDDAVRFITSSANGVNAAKILAGVNNDIANSIFKLDKEAADKFIDVAIKYEENFLNILKNCDDYIDDIVELTSREGNDFAEVIIKASADGNKNVKYIVDGAKIADDALRNNTAISQLTYSWKQVSDYYKMMTDVISEQAKNNNIKL